MVVPLTDQHHQVGHQGKRDWGLKKWPISGRRREDEVHKVLGRGSRSHSDPKIWQPADKAHDIATWADCQPTGALAKVNALGGTKLRIVPRIHVSFIEDLSDGISIEMGLQDGIRAVAESGIGAARQDPHHVVGTERPLIRPGKAAGYGELGAPLPCAAAISRGPQLAMSNGETASGGYKEEGARLAKRRWYGAPVAAAIVGGDHIAYGLVSKPVLECRFGKRTREAIADSSVYEVDHVQGADGGFRDGAPLPCRIS